MFQPLFVLSDWGLLILRVVLGLVLLVHGWPKLKSLKGTAENFELMGFKPGILWGTVVAFLEFFGGLAMIVGFLTQAVAFLIAVQFLVILVKVKRGQAFAGGYEFDLLILAAAVALLTLGAGFLSFEGMLPFFPH